MPDGWREKVLVNKTKLKESLYPSAAPSASIVFFYFLIFRECVYDIAVCFQCLAGLACIITVIIFLLFLHIYLSIIINIACIF